MPLRFMIHRVIAFFYDTRNKVPASQYPRITLFALFSWPTKEACLVSSSAPDKTAALEFGPPALGNALFDKVAIFAAGDLLGFTEVGQDVFDGLFSQGLVVEPRRRQGREGGFWLVCSDSGRKIRIRTDQALRAIKGAIC